MNPSISEALLTTLGENFLHISEAAEVGVLSKAMISRLMEQKKEVKDQTILRLKTFVAWLSSNTMAAERKDEVVETLDFHHFTHKELATDVRKSGLYHSDRIMERMDEIMDRLKWKGMFNSTIVEFYKNLELERINGLLKTKENEVDTAKEDIKRFKDCIPDLIWRDIQEDLKDKYAHI